MTRWVFPESSQRELSEIEGNPEGVSELARANQTPYNLNLFENEIPDPGVDMFSRHSARAGARGNS
jgi:hypothetical protein